MSKCHEILFIGSFLSISRGTKGIAESMSGKLLEDGIKLKLVSKFENKLLRILDIIFSILFYKEKKIHIDVFSGSAFTIAEIASIIAKCRKKEIILTLHGGKLTEFAEDHLFKLQKVFDRAKYIQTPSLFLQSYFQKKGINIQYLPNSISLDKFPYSTKNRKEYSILWVRAFNPIYNPQIAVEILKEMKKKYPKCTLTMVGPNKGELNKVKQLAYKFNLLDSIFFTGSIENENLKKYYQTHEVFVNTTSYESFGVAVMEAASCGIPIVSNSVGEIPLLWEDKKNILLVYDNNIEEYVKHISSIFENDKLSENLTINARKKAEEFSWEKIKANWISILTK